MIDVLWCRVLVKDKIHFILSCLNFLRFQASRPSIAMDVAFVRTSAAKPATELSMQRAWGRPAGTCRRIVARDAEQGNEASCVTKHLFLRHVSPMNWAGRQFSQSTFYHVYCTSVFAAGPNFSNFSEEEEEAVHKSCSDLMQKALM